MSAIPVVPVRDARVPQPGERLVGERVASDGADHPHASTEVGGGDRLVRAFPARHAYEVVTDERLPRPRQPLHARDEVEVDRADNGELNGHAGGAYAAARL